MPYVPHMRLSWVSTEQLRRHGVGAARLLKMCLVNRIFVYLMNQGNMY